MGIIYTSSGRIRRRMVGYVDDLQLYGRFGRFECGWVSNSSITFIITARNIRRL
jgi:hypothetical protein